jgi:hypothetical protein
MIMFVIKPIMMCMSTYYCRLMYTAYARTSNDEENTAIVDLRFKDTEFKLVKIYIN